MSRSYLVLAVTCLSGFPSPVPSTAGAAPHLFWKNGGGWLQQRIMGLWVQCYEVDTGAALLRCTFVLFWKAELHVFDPAHQKAESRGRGRGHVFVDVNSLTLTWFSCWFVSYSWSTADCRCYCLLTEAQFTCVSLNTLNAAQLPVWTDFSLNLSKTMGAQRGHGLTQSAHCHTNIWTLSRINQQSCCHGNHTETFVYWHMLKLGLHTHCVCEAAGLVSVGWFDDVREEPLNGLFYGKFAFNVTNQISFTKKHFSCPKFWIWGFMNRTNHRARLSCRDGWMTHRFQSA